MYYNCHESFLLITDLSSLNDFISGRYQSWSYNFSWLSELTTLFISNTFYITVNLIKTLTKIWTIRASVVLFKLPGVNFGWFNTFRNKKVSVDAFLPKCNFQRPYHVESILETIFSKIFAKQLFYLTPGMPSIDFQNFVCARLWINFVQFWQLFNCSCLFFAYWIKLLLLLLLIVLLIVVYLLYFIYFSLLEKQEELKENMKEMKMSKYHTYSSKQGKKDSEKHHKR